MKTQVVIIGAGLSGLYSAYLLEQLAIEYVIVEARERIGGRVLSQTLDNDVSEHKLADHKSSVYDLGPSWIWPDINPRIKQLIEQFTLPVFSQYATGAYLMETSSELPVKRYNNGFVGQPESMRLSGGVASLTGALSKALKSNSIELNTQVEKIGHSSNGGFTLLLNCNTGKKSLTADQVITAMPLRLLAQSIEFSPALPAAVSRQFLSTPTWMAAHAKFVAIYELPFWREQGLSGSASSRVGPLAEIHDASAQVGKAALFGFVGIDAVARKSLGEEVLKQAAIEQLTHIFGDQASRPLQVKLLDWSQQVFTATRADQTATDHPSYGLSSSAQALSQTGLFIAGSEAAQQYGGYLEGALASAQYAVDKLVRQHKMQLNR
jgi:monoamine oxidase